MPFPQPEDTSNVVVEEAALQTEEPVATMNHVLSTDSPISVATNIMEQALHENDQNASEQASEAGDRAKPPSHARTIAQLESWLRSIERRRRDMPSGDSSS